MSTISQANKRSAQREKTLLPAVVASLDGRSSFDCLIKDLSKTGARLAIRDSVSLPDLFFVINARERQAYQAKLVWRSKGVAGVHFQSSVYLNAAINPSLRFLNRLWVQRVAR